MSALRNAFHDYLAVRRALGYKLRLEGRLLSRFVDFAERSGAEYITTELAVNWATQPMNAQPPQWANRLAMAPICAILPPQRPTHRGAAA